MAYLELPSMSWKAPSPTPGELAIMSWGVPSDGFTVSFASALHDAGFNLCVAGAITKMDVLDTTLANLAGANLKYFPRYGVYTPKLEGFPTSTLSATQKTELGRILPTGDKWAETYGHWTKLADHLSSPINRQIDGQTVDVRNAIAGFMIGEEPLAVSFWGISSYAHLLYDKLYGKLPTGSIPGLYVNFLPHLCGANDTGTVPVYSEANLKRYTGGMNEASSWIGGYTPISSYDDYLDLAEKLMNLSHVSFDSYPFFVYDRSEEGYKNQMIQFFSSLVCFQQRKKNKGTDFWSVIFSVKRDHVTIKSDGKTIKTSGMPTIGQIRFAVYTSLLYGATGIAYWTTVAESESNFSGKVEYTYNSEAPFTPEGSTTSIYTSVKSVNKAVKTVQDIFLNTKIAMTAVTTAPPHVLELKEIPGILSTKTNFGLFEKIEAAGKGVVMAHLYNSKYNYLAVVNMDYAKSQSVTFTLRTGATLVFCGGENTAQAISVTAGARTEVFAPGDMRIFRYAR